MSFLPICILCCILKRRGLTVMQCFCALKISVAPIELFCYWVKVKEMKREGQGAESMWCCEWKTGRFLWKPLYVIVGYNINNSNNQLITLQFHRSWSAENFLPYQGYACNWLYLLYFFVICNVSNLSHKYSVLIRLLTELFRMNIEIDIITVDILKTAVTANSVCFVHWASSRLYTDD